MGVGQLRWLVYFFSLHTSACITIKVSTQLLSLIFPCEMCKESLQLFRRNGGLRRLMVGFVFTQILVSQLL